MNDYIKREDALNFETSIEADPDDMPQIVRGMKLYADYLKSIDVVDAVPVVRCRDCKHRAMDEPGMVYCKNIVGGWVSDDFYCSDGEREKK